MENEQSADPKTDLWDGKPSTEEMKNELHALTLLNNRYLKEIKALKKENDYYKTQIKSSQMLLKENSANNKSGNESIILRDSYSVRAGQIFVNALAKPGKNTIMMPFRLIKLMFIIYFSRKK